MEAEKEQKRYLEEFSYLELCAFYLKTWFLGIVLVLKSISIFLKFEVVFWFKTFKILPWKISGNFISSYEKTPCFIVFMILVRSKSRKGAKIAHCSGHFEHLTSLSLKTYHTFSPNVWFLSCGNQHCLLLNFQFGINRNSTFCLWKFY